MKNKCALCFGSYIWKVDQASIQRTDRRNKFFRAIDTKYLNFKKVPFNGISFRLCKKENQTNTCEREQNA